MKHKVGVRLGKTTRECGKLREAEHVFKAHFDVPQNEALTKKNFFDCLENVESAFRLRLHGKEGTFELSASDIHFLHELMQTLDNESWANRPEIKDSLIQWVNAQGEK